MKLRYFFFISYKGTAFHGWQIQPNAITVQEEINKALTIINRSPVETVGSGRTDAGVHAKMQVFHADFVEALDSPAQIHKMNGLLPEGIVINDVKQVVEDAHSRFDAESRVYEYHISFIKSPFGKDESYYLTKRPNETLINQACKTILGENDFTSLSKVKTEVTNFNCTIFEANWQQSKDGAIFYVKANRFLRGMVRALVGTLLNIGFEKTSIDEFKAILLAKDRSAAGQSVPAQGLYLCQVRYPDHIFIKNNR